MTKNENGIEKRLRAVETNVAILTTRIEAMSGIKQSITDLQLSRARIYAIMAVVIIAAQFGIGLLLKYLI